MKSFSVGVRKVTALLLLCPPIGGLFSSLPPPMEGEAEERQTAKSFRAARDNFDFRLVFFFICFPFNKYDYDVIKAPHCLAFRAEVFTWSPVVSQ